MRQTQAQLRSKMRRLVAARARLSSLRDMENSLALAIKDGLKQLKVRRLASGSYCAELVRIPRKVMVVKPHDQLRVAKRQD